MKRSYIIFSILVALTCISLIIILATDAWEPFFVRHDNEEDEYIRTRVIIPAGLSLGPGMGDGLLWEEDFKTNIPMESNEIAVSVLTRESPDGLGEEQFVAYRRAYDPGGQIYLTWIYFDASSRAYRRSWNDSTAVTRPETISLFMQDLIGDRNDCIIVTGMNEQNEHTMTIFKRNTARADEPFRKIAQLQIDGSIVIQETARSLAYQQGLTTAPSFNIAAYGQDTTSSNILDQVETIYSYNARLEQYERTGVTRIPGTQIEQRQIREILSGNSGVFEEFINDLWYFVSPQGTIDTRQYIYFNPAGREIIFFGDDTQQIYHWINSTPTRFGLYIRTQNISIVTLRRFVDIELESLESIRIRVIEDIGLKISVAATWDGTYRRARNVTRRVEEQPNVFAMNVTYDSTWGRIHFFDTGEYSITTGGQTRGGRYAFFRFNDTNLLELRPNETDNADGRFVYRIDALESGSLQLNRVRLGIIGIQDMREIPVTFTPVAE